MKQFFVLATWLLLGAACRKQFTNVNADQSLAGSLKQQLTGIASPAILERIIFDTVYLSHTDNLRFAQFAVTGKSIADEFLVLMIDSSGKIQNGRFVSFEFGTDRLTGFVSVGSLNGEEVVTGIPLVNGYVQWKKSNAAANTAVQPSAGGKALPEVILVASKSKPSGMNYYWLYNLAVGGAAGVTGSSGYYSSVAGSPGGGGGSAGGSTKGSQTSPAGIDSPGKSGYTKDADVILVDFETAQEKPAIDVEKYLKCFEIVPDAGASCSIELFSDLPVDNDPSRLFNIKSESPGHCFIQLKKSGSGKSVIQNIGFYPKQNWKTILTPAPVEGKFVDNSLHEFNASFKMSLSAEDFRMTMLEIQRLSKTVKYDIDEFNCTDFVLTAFNVSRSSKFEAIKVDIPGAQAPFGSNTPQGVYLKLKEMKANRDAEAANITIGIVKGYVASGNGPCQ